MTTPSARSQELMSARQHADETLDAAAFAALFTDEGSFQMGAGEPAVGRRAIEASVAGFFANLTGIHHDVLHI